MTTKEEVADSFELLRSELKNKTEPVNWGPPEVIVIKPDDYHAEHVGRAEDGRQFFATGLFVPAWGDNPGNEYQAVFLFNDDGDLVESRIDQLGARATLDYRSVEALQNRRLAELGRIDCQDIKVKPFAVEFHDEMMGLIPLKFDDHWTVQLLPGNFMAFYEPWDSGEYDT